MPKRYLGNIITDTPTAPAGPYQDSAASGVWSLAEANAYTAAGLWPQSSNGSAPNALIAGGELGPNNSIAYIIISTTGNSTDYGDLTRNRVGATALASATRALIAGDQSPSSSIDFKTFTSDGNAVEFGDLLSSNYGMAACSNSTRGIWAGGSGTNVIQYVTIATESNTTDFGDLTQACYPGGDTGSGSSTRGILYLGTDSGVTAINVINYVTIASVGNATDFGDMTQFQDRYHASCSSSTRALFGGGGASNGDKTNVIEYVTIASTGNSIDFGDLTEARYEGPASTGSETRGLWLGGTTGFVKNIIDYVTIASTGNATDFGDLISTSAGGNKTTACSSVHGGLAA